MENFYNVAGVLGGSLILGIGYHSRFPWNFMLGILGALLILGALGIGVGSAEAGSRYNEAYYAERWCAQAGGQDEVVLPSGARADCLTPEYAVEVDWSNNWAQAIGQSLHYAEQTGLKAAIVLLIHEKSKQSHLYRLESTIASFGLPIEVFIIDAPKH